MLQAAEFPGEQVACGLKMKKRPQVRLWPGQLRGSVVGRGPSKAIQDSESG